MNRVFTKGIAFTVAVIGFAAQAAAKDQAIELDGWGLPPSGNMYSIVPNAPNQIRPDKMEPLVMDLLSKATLSFVWPDKEIRFGDVRVKQGEKFQICNGQNTFNLFPTEIKDEQITFHCVELNHKISIERKPVSLGAAKPKGFTQPIKQVIVK